MDFHDSMRISASGMDAARMRLDAAALNLANMHASAPAGAPLYQPQRVVTQSTSFARHYAQAGGGVRAALAPAAAAPRREYDPQHPHADATGYVAYPAVDHTGEMLSISKAQRNYEANVVAMNAARTMAARALTIGDQP